MRKLTTALSVAAALVLVPSALLAQTQTGDVTVTVPQVLVITSVTDLTISDTDTGWDFSNSDQSTVSGIVTIGTRANIPHDVQVTGAGLTYQSGGYSGADMVLQVETGTSTWADVGATAVTVLDALARGSHSSPVTFRTTADVANQGPGTYSGTITYTVVADDGS